MHPHEYELFNHKPPFKDGLQGKLHTYLVRSQDFDIPGEDEFAVVAEDFTILPSGAAQFTDADGRVVAYVANPSVIWIDIGEEDNV